METSHDRGQCDAAGSLDIVVEAGDLGAITVENATGWKSQLRPREYLNKRSRLEGKYTI
jgi:hypothetical protein